jgi:hypothetical protein
MTRHFIAYTRHSKEDNHPIGVIGNVASREKLEEADAEGYFTHQSVL